MKKPIKRLRVPMVAAIVASIIAVMGITVYASGILNIFTFQKDDKLVTLRTTESTTEQQAKQIVQDSEIEMQNIEDAKEADFEDFTFENIQQAEKELDIKVIVPSVMPEMTTDNITGSIASFGDDVKTKTLWVNYRDDNQRVFGITITREVITPGADMTRIRTNDLDEGSLSSYKSKSGVEYTTLTESSDDGSKTANMAVAMVGEYEYILVFSGFTEKEMHQIIDSTDLSDYSL